MKLLFLFITVTFLNADYLYQNTCVIDLSEEKKGYCYVYSNDGSSDCDKNAVSSDFVDGYSYIDGSCVVSDYNSLGLSVEDYGFYMALMGNFVGFTVLFFAIMIVISI